MTFVAYQLLSLTFDHDICKKSEGHILLDTFSLLKQGSRRCKVHQKAIEITWIRAIHVQKRIQKLSLQVLESHDREDPEHDLLTIRETDGARRQYGEVPSTIYRKGAGYHYLAHVQDPERVARIRSIPRPFESL